MNTLTTEQLGIFNKAVKDAYNHREDGDEMQDLSDCHKNVKAAILEFLVSNNLFSMSIQNKDDCACADILDYVFGYTILGAGRLAPKKGDKTPAPHYFIQQSDLQVNQFEVSSVHSFGANKQGPFQHHSNTQLR